MSKSAKKRLRPLEERFEFQDGLRPADAAVLQPALYPVFDRQTQFDRTLRLWRKTGGPADVDLRELWLHERRQLQRLMAGAHVREVFVGILEFVEDDEEFGVLLEDAGRPLSRLLRLASERSWLRSLSASRPREILWRNFKRLAQALALLHAQGLVHGRLDTDAVFTQGAEEADFRLGGFEWSLWFAAPASAIAQPSLSSAASLRPGAYSFAGDWNALGLVFAGLLGVELAGKDIVASKGKIAAELSLPERLLLRQLLLPSRTEALDPVSIMRAVDSIAAEAARMGAARAGTLILLMPEAAGLGAAVARATDGAVEREERELYESWAAADMQGGATLFSHGATDNGPERMMLVTSTLAYNLRAFTEQGGEASWDIAYCSAVALRDEAKVGAARDPAGHELRQRVELVRGPRQATELRARLGGSVLDWGKLSGTPGKRHADGSLATRRSLVLVQALEAYVRSLEVLPVEVIECRGRPGRYTVVLRARKDGERDDVARKIGLSSTADTLRSLFEEDEAAPSGEWYLGVNPGLGGRARDIPARFRGTARTRGILGYEFEAEERPVQDAPVFLRSRRDAGAERVIRRRLANVRALADQPTVADTLADPWQVRRSRPDAPDEDDAFRELDPPKQEALRRIWATGPAFMVVGPPGVGKTHLATEVIRRRFAAEPSSRLLITAQGHDALDNLEDELAKALAAADARGTFVFRPPRPRKAEAELGASEGGDGDDAEPATEDPSQAISDMLDALAGSDLAARALPSVRSRLEAIAAAARPGATKKPRPPELRRALRAMTALAEDAANVVISTANSPTVERLVEERSHFDAVIIEEAAKVTGPEMAGVLALSGSSLLIGDHKQLPPFDAGRLENLLANEALLKRVLDAAEERVGILFEEGELRDLSRALTDPATFDLITRRALRLVQPFRTYVEDDDRRDKAGQNRARMSAWLTEQRRMHPAIARIVSQTFYDGLLTTNEKRAREADEKPPPVDVLHPMPQSPLVVMDFPHVSLSGRGEPAERDDPRWHNPEEVDAVVDVLRHVRAAPSAEKPPTLAVLSPYRAQVIALRERLRQPALAGELAHLAAFRPVRARLGLVSTVDAFQGSEADLVILTLVRNNARAGRGALGFLRDERRMNVLLSRAKARLVLVGSLRFLKEAVRGVTPYGDAGELSFIVRAIACIDEARACIGPAGVPRATAVRPDELRVRA